MKYDFLFFFCNKCVYQLSLKLSNKIISMAPDYYSMIFFFFHFNSIEQEKFRLVRIESICKRQNNCYCKIEF